MLCSQIPHVRHDYLFMRQILSLATVETPARPTSQEPCKARKLRDSKGCSDRHLREGRLSAQHGTHAILLSEQH